MLAAPALSATCRRPFMEHDRVVPGDQLARFHLLERRLKLRADAECVGTAGMEAAPTRRMHQIRDVAGNRYDVAFQAQPWPRSEQGLRVWVAGRPKQVLGPADLSNPPGI